MTAFPRTCGRSLPPVELHQDPEWVHARLFSVDRRLNALDIRTGMFSGGHVVTVGEGADQLDDAIDAAATDYLSPRYGYARSGFIRRALRPASGGAGRGRWRQ
jgi:hypothetical protein